MANPSGSEGPRVDDNVDAPSPANIAVSGADAELLRSLHQLSITTSQYSRSPSRASSASPNPSTRTLSRLDRLTIGSSPSPHLRNSASRSPGTRSVSGSNIHSPSRSATPTPLRKASINSLQSLNGTPANRAPSGALLSPATARLSMNGGSKNIMEAEDRPPKTEASVAHVYFARELELHHANNLAPKSDTLVILQDACFKHRYQRPFAGKLNLGTIVERPERLQAVYTGVAMAYVRLGERHQEGKHQIGPGLDPATLQIPFDIRKTDCKMPLNSAQVTNVHGTKWMEELALLCNSAKSKLDAGALEIQRPEMDRGPDAKEPEPFHRGDLYLSPESIVAFEGALGATCEAVDAVFSDSPTKRAFVAVRPPGHHCDTKWPHGFCWLNNVQVGIMHGFMNHGLTHAAIIDFDLHHGDGSQDIAWEYNKRKHQAKGHSAQWKKSSIGYFSLHDIQSYPCEEGEPDAIKKASLCIEDAFSQNIWNVHLQQWKDHPDFWYQYRTRVTIVLEKARAYLRRESEKHKAAGQEPRAAIFFSAGFDASEYETQGMQRHGVNVPTEFYARISRDVVKMSFEEGLAVDGRIVSCLEGGYSDRALSSGVLAHLSGLAGGDVRAKEDTTSGLSRSGSHRMSLSLSSSPLSRRSTVSSESDARSKAPGFPYESSWWASSELDRLDAAQNATPIVQPRAPRNVPTPTYCSPTQASNAKVSELARFRRSMSGLSSLNPEPQIVARAPSPPPPAVQWPAAAVELSRLLIPSDEQVSSITWEELRAEEARIKKDQKDQKERDRKLLREQKERERLMSSSSPSEIPAAAEAPSVSIIRKSGRERKHVSYVEPEDPNKNRRRTVAGAAAFATEKITPRENTAQDFKDTQQPSRPLSASSALDTTIATGSALPSLPLAFSSADARDRPVVAQTVRPDSSLSIRTAAGTLPLKKTRPAVSRKSSSKTAAPNAKKARTVAPKGPTGISKAKTKETATTSWASARSSKSSSPTRAQVNDVGQSSSKELSVAQSTAASDSGTDLGGITNGMRKIKINVITKEMKEARKQAERQSTPIIDESKASLETLKIETPEAVAAQNPAPGLIPTPSNPEYAAPAMDSQQLPPQPTTPNEDEVPIPQSSPFGIGFDTPVPAPAPSAAQNSNLFIPYQPEGATPQAVSQAAPMTWMPLNTVETPAAFRGHNFTATSAIPFSPSPSKLHQRTPPMNNFPAPPRSRQQEPSTGSFPAPHISTNERESLAGSGPDHEMSTESTDVKDNGDHVWEITESPERRF